MSDAVLQQIAIDSITPSPHNPRRFRKDDAELASLADSIRAKGVLQPILVRPLPDPLDTDKVPQFELIAGERRWRASRKAERDTIPAIVREGLTDQEALELTVLENLQREDLSPLEEAAGVASLLAGGKPAEEVADQLGKPVRWVRRRARLDQLSPLWRKFASDPAHVVSSWSAAMLDVVAGVEPASQEQLATSSGGWWMKQATGVDDVVRAVANSLHELKNAPWKLDDGTIVPLAGPCSTCLKRSSCNPGLFDDEIEPQPKGAAPDDRCLDTACWGSKLEAFLEAKAKSLAQKHDGRIVFSDGNGGMPSERPAFTKGKKHVSSWEGTKASANTPGAAPVLIISGPQAGKSEYRTFATDGSKGGSTRTPKEKAKSIEARRAELRERRYTRALELFEKDLAKEKEPQVAILLRLLAVLGLTYYVEDVGRPEESYTHPLFEFNASRSKKAASENPSLSQVLSGITAKEASAVLWKNLKQVLHDCMQVPRYSHDDKTPAEGMWAPALTIARLLEVDAEAFLQAAIRELPEPKGWAEEEAKAAAAAAKKATPAKKTAPAKKKATG